MSNKIKDLSLLVVNLSKQIYGDEQVSLHRPLFIGNEQKYLSECIDSNFVSSSGKRIEEFEQKIVTFTGAKYAIAMVNGTSALHIAIKLAGISDGQEVITQALTFVATCNAIRYVGAEPVFIDVDKDTMGMSPSSLKSFLEKNAIKRNNGVFNKLSGKKIKACIPMHTFGFPTRIDQISDICSEWGIELIEDSAESLGSFVGEKHTGTFGKMAIISFNGNKIITTGGGGAIITNNKYLADKARHISSTAKLKLPYKFTHDEIGFNYRMPNLNASLGIAQIENLKFFLLSKKKIADLWEDALGSKCVFIKSVKGSKSNNWLNTLILNSKEDRDFFLKFTNERGVMTRPVWTLMSNLPMYKNCLNDGLINSKWFEKCTVNIPSSAITDLNKEIFVK